jgi:hypothetical protein
MKRWIYVFSLLQAVFWIEGCSTAYEAKPISFRLPSAYKNTVNVGGAQIAAKAYANPDEAKRTFGFDVLGAGMLPVQVIFDNQGPHELEVIGNQSFLEDLSGNLWPILTTRIANERATKYARTRNLFKEGAQKGFLGAAAGAVVGAAIGIVTGGGLGENAGKGAAVGAAAGTVIGGAGGYVSDEPDMAIINDMRDKSLQNAAIEPGTIAHGILFFPVEASSASSLRLQIIENDTRKVHSVTIRL